MVANVANFLHFEFIELVPGVGDFGGQSEVGDDGGDVTGDVVGAALDQNILSINHNLS